MKKFLLFFSFIALLCLPWAGRAQTQTLTVFDGENTSSYVPVHGLWADAFLKCEIVYPADQLEEMTPGSTLSQMTFYLTTPATEAWTGTFQVFLTEVPSTTISSYQGPTGATIVYEGTLDGTNSTMTIAFSNDYTYTGGNLLVGVYQITKGNWKSATFGGTTVTGASIGGYSSSSLDAVTANQRSFIPKTTFSYIPGTPITCPKPTNLTVSDTATHSVVLNWTENGTATSWQICLNGDEANLINVTSHPYTLSGLASEAPYTVKVRANCGGGDLSYWSNTAAFNTLIACARPTNLTASITPGNGSIATLSWTPADANASWVLQYGTDNTFAAGTYIEETVSGTPSIDLTGLTPETHYYARVSAICDNSEESQWTSVCSFTPTDAYRIGSGTATNNYLPSYNYFNFGFSQQIYTAEEIGTSGIISSIAFYNAGALKSRTYDIYLVNTPKTAFDSTKDWIAVTADDLVFTGEVTMTPGEWTTITFSNEFFYDASYNLAVIMDDNTSAYSSSPHMACLVFPSTSSSLYAYSDGTNYMPYNPGSHTGTIGNIKNQILLGITPSGGSVCLKPTGVTVNNITGHTADLNWTPSGDATAWQICLNNDETNLIDVTESPYTFTGLNSETTYTVKMRTNCGDDGFSGWTSVVTFTTDVACPAPTALNAEIIGTTANLSWEGSADSYVVKYRVAGSDGNFYEDFENGLDQWTLVDADGDGYNWLHHINTGSGNLTAHSGLGVAYSMSYDNDYGALTPDNWLISPQVPMGGTVSLWAVGQDASYAAENFAIYVSTTGTNISDFTQVSQEYTATDTYTQYSADLSSYTGMGYVAIRHYDITDMFYLNIDDITITGGEVIPAGEWVSVVVTDNNATISGLNPETTYEWTVQGVCTGEEAPSAWSSSTFTTDVACPVPTVLNADNITGNSADLSWNGISDSYTVQYRVAGGPVTSFFEDFENGLDNWTIYTEGDALLSEGWFILNGTESNPISGENVACAFSYYEYGETDYVLDADNWLVTPQIQLQGTLKFWVKSAGGTYPEHYSVLLSTTGNAIADFTTTLQEYGPASGDWTQVAIDLTSYAGQEGYIAIHHVDSDAYYIFIDDFGIYTGEIPTGDWMTATTTGTTLTVTGLAPETTYEWQVQGTCDGENTDWSILRTFTTDELHCLTPTNLSYEDGSITTNSVVLNWTDLNEATAWQICVNGDEDHLEDAVTNTFTLSGLTPNTSYTVKVRAICDVEVYSDWCTELTFTTEPEIIPSYVTISGTTEICPGSTTTLTATTDVEATFEWSNSETTPSITATEGAYTVTVTSTTGNQLSETVTVTLFPTYEVTDEITICQSELPYNYNGMNLTEAGVYPNLLLHTIHGCDSLVNLTLIVNPIYEITDIKTICDNELPYEWNGVTFTEAGTETVTLTSSQNCDSVVTMILNINPVQYGIDGWTICSSSLPYEWNGVTFEEAGTQTATLTAANNCDSIVTMTLIVKESFTAAETRTICASLLPYEWNGVTFEEAGIQDVTLDAVNGCDSVVTMTLIVNPTYAIDETRTVCTSALPYTWNGVEFTEAGTQAVTLQTVNGCDSVITMTVLVSSAYEVSETQTICASLLPYTWNEVSFTEAGTQVVTLQSSNGCDSIVTMTLVVNPIYDVTDEATICASLLPYEWNGVTFTEAGTQVATLQTVNGCDSVVTMTLTVNPTYNVTDEATICASALPYEWNGVTFTEAGTQTVTLQTVNECDSVVTMTLTVNPIYDVTDEATICASLLPYEWNGITFTEAGTQTVTLQTVNNCDSVVTMTLTVNPIYNVTDEATICASALPYEWNGVTFTEAGTQVATLQTINGCDSVVTMTLTVNPVYNVTDEATICASALPYTWNGLTFTEAGTQVATLQTINGCDSVVTMTLTVNPTYNVTDAATICADLLPYTWNGITFTEAGTQVATLQTVNGCDSVVTMTLTVNALPTITITGETAICQGESTTLTAAGASTYAWSTDATTAAINVNQSGTYTVTGTDANGCVNSANVTVIVNMPTTGTDVQTACNSYTWIDGTTYTASTNMPTYTLTNAAGCDSVVTLNLTINYSSYGTETRAICANELPYTWNGVTFTAAGTETATLTNAAGCDSIVTMTLAVNSLPTITISGNEVFCQGGSTTLTAAGASTYAWSTAATTAAINVDQAGTYTVTGTDVNGCTNTANVTVTMNVPTTGVDEQTACDSYTWIDGNTYTASTNTPTYTLTNAAGCDSVVTLHLTINNSVTSEFTIETNEGCYNWNGTEYCQSGDYTQNLQTAAGCDSVVTLHLTVGVGVEDFEIENVFLTPNPATNVCRINGLETVPASVDLYDMNGKLVRHATDTEFDVSMLPTGIYMVRVTTDDNRIINLKMVKR